VAKRRAANRRQRRERVRQLGAIFFIAIFVLGTASIAFVTQQAANQSSATAGTTTTPVAGATSAPGATVIQVTTVAGTPTEGNAIQQIIDKGDEAAAKNDWTTAIGFYKSAMALSPSNATLLFKYGKALGSSGDYAGATSKLQEAVDLNPSATFAGEAKQLIDTYKAKVTPGTQGTPTSTK
jgi:Flp pilus assembly protein TadD